MQVRLTGSLAGCGCLLNSRVTIEQWSEYSAFGRHVRGHGVSLPTDGAMCACDRSQAAGLPRHCAAGPWGCAWGCQL
ncbi:hypothetical protein SLNWT_5317 [Streptomyces albus]|uniref:Uncharacterized protein n=1 Tax=Streptomyces albus (strain ATCC 21838 / DSM 41398 / FERM P-419 / JCM 4703 / NBRC 107858) TaxID=1081613 RepID=A0A0B5ESB7_STRA4|nr:hypothetical protein SLNWT_5317 [Streptomyces albus]AOU79995.1 hypothetical protein SLNHY_5304 [Streptomyces albus]AYN35712.1 hypothetical protein DUI70_5217 [Streptomyces albus]